MKVCDILNRIHFYLPFWFVQFNNLVANVSIHDPLYLLDLTVFSLSTNDT